MNRGYLAIQLPVQYLGILDELALASEQYQNMVSEGTGTGIA
jgi:hypothetical protein